MKYFNYDFTDEEAKKSLVLSCEKEFGEALCRAAKEVLSHKNLKFITLSGPTCSGKTTTAGIIIEKLREAGKNVVLVSIDDFFIDKDILIKEAERRGEPLDMDSVRAIDLEALKNFVDGIERLVPLKLPKYDFTVSKRSHYVDITPTENDIYIFEGIQAVYPEVTALFEKEHLISIYISVEDGISSTCGSWLPRELRLVRRIVRDSRLRNTDAEATFRHWSGVAANEIKNIEPYSALCDITLDSGMEYEVCVLKKPLIALLEKIDEGSEYYLRAKMLLEKAVDFPDIDEGYVPEGSVLREFIG